MRWPGSRTFCTTRRLLEPPPRPVSSLHWFVLVVSIWRCDNTNNHAFTLDFSGHVGPFPFYIKRKRTFMVKDTF